MNRQWTRTPVVLVLAERAPQDLIRQLVGDLERLGVVAQVASTASEALWNIEGRHTPIVAVVVDAVDLTADRIDFLVHIHESHPLLRRVLLVSGILNPEARECFDVIIEKPWTAESMASGLRLPHS